MPLPVVITTNAGRSCVSAPEPVEHPRAQARPARLREAGVEEDLRRRVVELVGLHRLDEADVVRRLRQVRQHLGELRAALAVLRELEPRPEHRRIGPDEGVALPADDRRRERLALRVSPSSGL